MSSSSLQVSCSNPFNTVLLLMSSLKSFSRPYGCISKSSETKGNWSQLPPLSLWHTVSPHNTWAHSKQKISTPCGNNKTQLIIYKVTWSLLCFESVCVSEHGNESSRKTPNLVCHPVSAKIIPPVSIWLVRKTMWFCKRKVCRSRFTVIGASTPHKFTNWTWDLHI